MSATQLVLLSEDETRALARHEETIRDGLRDFVRVGMALKEIRDRRLYRAGHDTFEDYCRAQWDLSTTAAYRKIECSSLVLEMSPMGDIQNERQARALLKVPEEKRGAAMENAKAIATSEDRPMTARDILEFISDGNAPQDVKFLRVKRVALRAIAVIYSVRPELFGDIAHNQAELAAHLNMTKQAFNEYIKQFRMAFPEFESQAFRSKEARAKMSAAMSESWEQRRDEE